MFDRTAVITFSGTPIHRELQQEFTRLYSRYFNSCHEYTIEQIKETEFFKENIDVFKYEKYCGYFLWKPFIILDALSTSNCDYVLYCDSNLRIKNINSLSEYFKAGIETEGIFIPKYNHYFNSHWTKKDTFILMGADELRYWDANQVWTVIMGFDRSKRTMELLSEYMKYCKDPRIVTEIPSTMGQECPGFVAHRWEQSVMSILVERYGIKGTLYNSLLPVVDKIYPPNLQELKKKVDENPLKEASLL